MARAELTIRIADIDAVRLFVWELRMLADEMRVAADPYSDRLEHALDRFTADPEDPEGAS